MTLRLRLVLALLVLLTTGLALFGVATYSLYAHSEYQRLDTQIRSSELLIHEQLDAAAGRVIGPGPGSPTGGPPEVVGQSRGVFSPAPVVPPPCTYGELRDSAGTILSHLQLSSSCAQPHLPANLPNPGPNGRLFSVGASNGSGSFRVLVNDRGQTETVLAVPTTEVTDALRRLTLIEAVGAVSLLVILTLGSWLVLRRGLRPLERMAHTARTINAGDLSQRVSVSGPSEVGQLGLALNNMLVDIEEAFREREATELRLRQFLADVSHELRTPLTSIQGFAELFRVSGDRARVDLPTILRRIEEESARMKVLVEDLLLLARLDQSRPVDRVAVDLAVLAADACSDAVAHAPDRAVTLDAPEPVVVAGDEAYLRQAIANLVTNALRHTPAATPIEVSAALGDGWAEVAVRDHGGGLDDDALAHVFDRFWQADKARVGTGAGLGLAMVSGIAAEHGGTATAANADGGGAVFTVRVPLMAPARVGPHPPGDAAEANDAPPPRERAAEVKSGKERSPLQGSSEGRDGS